MSLREKIHLKCCRNRSAENLYGWKDYEVIGQRVGDELLIAEEHYVALQRIMERLTRGQSWSGQFPLKKRSGETFMAMVTRSPLYENGILVGCITVSSDAALFNITLEAENLRTNQESTNCQHRARQSFLKRIQWHPPRPHIAPVPEIVSSVSNLVLICHTSTVFFHLLFVFFLNHFPQHF